MFYIFSYYFHVFQFLFCYLFQFFRPPVCGSTGRLNPLTDAWIWACPFLPLLTLDVGKGPKYWKSLGIRLKSDFAPENPKISYFLRWFPQFSYFFLFFLFFPFQRTRPYLAPKDRLAVRSLFAWARSRESVWTVPVRYNCVSGPCLFAPVNCCSCRCTFPFFSCGNVGWFFSF